MGVVSSLQIWADDIPDQLRLMGAIAQPGAPGAPVTGLFWLEWQLLQRIVPRPMLSGPRSTRGTWGALVNKGQFQLVTIQTAGVKEYFNNGFPVLMTSGINLTRL